MRLASRAAGNREATPDQDDIRAPSDDEGGDGLAAAVAAALARDRALEEELKGNAAVRAAAAAEAPPTEDYGMGADRTVAKELYDSDGEDEGAPSGDRQGGGGGLARCGSDGEGDDGVVDFDYDGAAYPPLRGVQKRKRARWESAGGPAPSVAPGALTHAGAGDAAPAADLFSSGAADGATFGALGLHPPLAAHLEALGFAAPTWAQRGAIPPLLAGRDALVKAPTGSGKTLAYLAPILHDLATLEPRVGRGEGTLALVITPTRELALQVVDAATLLARRFVWVVPGAVHGGENRAKEKARLRKGVALLVATPGRLVDHLENTTAFRIDALRWLVLDEADRLLDLGFEKKIARILELVGERAGAEGAGGDRPPVRRRSVLLSATLHRELGALAGLSLEDPAVVGWEVGRDAGGKITLAEADPDGDHTPAANGPNPPANASDSFDIPKQLRQSFMTVPCKLRLVALAAALRLKVSAAPGRAKVVVFFSNCDSVEFHHRVLDTGAWAAAAGGDLLPPSAPLLKLHGNMPQAERTATLLRFTKAPAGVLLCTDVAARGLDFPAVTAIIQFDPAGSAQEYVHRCGRTARLGHAGDALLFVQPSERGYVDHLRRLGAGHLAEDDAAATLDRTLGLDAKAGKGLPIERHHGAFRLQKEIMDAVAGDRGLKAAAEAAFRSSVRAYATHAAELKTFFSVRTLHLGHVAHSFGLQETPTMVGKGVSKGEAARRRRDDPRAGGGGGGGGGAQGKKKPRQGFQAVAKAGKGGYVLS